MQVAALYTEMDAARAVAAPGGGPPVPLVELVRRLYPFFRHNMHAVRRAVLRIVTNLLRLPPAGPADADWLPAVLPEVLPRPRDPPPRPAPGAPVRAKPVSSTASSLHGASAAAGREFA